MCTNDFTRNYASSLKKVKANIMSDVTLKLPTSGKIDMKYVEIIKFIVTFNIFEMYFNKF